MTDAPVQAGTSAAPDAVRTVAFVSLGCPKNLVDSEKMLGLLVEDGLMPVSDEEIADALVVNTCGFLEASKDESMEVIREAAERKRDGRLKRLVVAGCLVQRHRAKMLQWCPEIDALIGVFDRDQVAAAVRGGASGRGGPSASPAPIAGDVVQEAPAFSSIAANATLARKARGLAADPTAGYYESDAARLRLTPRHYAYLRVGEGCNQNCAFCTIPSIRGKMRSKPIDALTAEARELILDGAFELNLIGQDTTSYGEDVGYEPGLAGMLESLNETVDEAAAGQAWLRLMYAYPSCFTDGMIEAIARLPRVVKYIDMPLQHINDRVLDSMKRRTSRELIETLLGKLRDRVPGIAIRTTFISGYPGETEAEHEELVAFIRDFGFDAVGVFGYSPEPGTPAGRLHEAGGAIGPDVIEQRIEQLMLAQQDVAFARNDRLVDEAAAFDVLIEDEADEGMGIDDLPDAALYVGRTYAQAPEIDAVTYLASHTPLSPGELVPATIIGSHDYDLIARPTAELQRGASLPVIG